MKLRLAMSRSGRDTADIVSLVAELDIESAGDAESIFSAYYPVDGLNDGSMRSWNAPWPTARSSRPGPSRT